jgi:hypothetical protein
LEHEKGDPGPECPGVNEQTMKKEVESLTEKVTKFQ